MSNDAMILKIDARGRVPVERQVEWVHEFKRSRLSGPQLAATELGREIRVRNGGAIDQSHRPGVAMLSFADNLNPASSPVGWRP